MAGDSCPWGCGFESRQQILAGQFFTYIVVKIVMFVWKRPKINDKRGREWAIFIKNTSNSTYSANFVKVLKIYHFLVKSFLGNFYWHLAIFFWSHWQRLWHSWMSCCFHHERTGVRIQSFAIFINCHLYWNDKNKEKGSRMGLFMIIWGIEQNISAQKQCDQMAKLFANIWPLTPMKFAQQHHKFAKVR